MQSILDMMIYIAVAGVMMAVFVIAALAMLAGVKAALREMTNNEIDNKSENNDQNKTRERKTDNPHQ